MSSFEENEIKIQEAKQAYLDAKNDWDRQTAEGEIKYAIYCSYISKFGNNDEETQLTAIKLADKEMNEFVAEIKKIYSVFN